MRLKEKVVVITGSARGIGRATATAMAQEGAIVVVTDRDADAAERTARDRRGGVRGPSRRLGFGADRDSVRRGGGAARSGGHPGQQCRDRRAAPHGRHALEVWERILWVNLTGAFRCSQNFARRAIADGRGGRIVNIVSLSGQKGGAGRSAYGASKAGLEVLTKVMAVELADHGINANAIAPGPIATETGRAMHTRETVDAYHRLIPQRRYGEPEEIAVAAVFLASDDAAYITGHRLNVDGCFLAAGLMFPFDQKRHRPLADAS